MILLVGVLRVSITVPCQQWEPEPWLPVDCLICCLAERFPAPRRDKANSITSWDFVRYLLDWKALVRLGNTGGIWAFQGESHKNWNSEWLSDHKSIHWSWIKCQNLANFHWLLLEHVHGHHYSGCVAIVFKGLHVITWDQSGGGGGGGQQCKSLVVDTSSTCILILSLHVRLITQYMLF